MANQNLAEFVDKIQEIINILSDDEVISLATTITGGLLKSKISSREDAFKGILNYSEDIKSILRRKVFTREKLISYLYDKDVPVKLPITKPEIIETILQLWNINTGDSKINYPKHESEFFENVESQSTSEWSEENNAQTNENRQISEEAYINKETSIVGTSQNEDINVQETVKVLAKQFSVWFYKLLNENELSSEHFFPDAILNLVVVLNGDTNNENICNDTKNITDTLKNVRNQYNLYFNPNLMVDSLKAQMDSHGLVMVIVGGTLHVNSVCVGVFEQMFALARDPFAENNWKIKRTDLRLISGDNNSDPSRLQDTNNETLNLCYKSATE